MDWLILFYFPPGLDDNMLLHVIHSPAFDTLQACTLFMEQQWSSLQQYISELHPRVEAGVATCETRDHLQRYYPQLFPHSKI